MRDERLLVRAHEAAGAGDEWIERGLIVALGLLGHAVPAQRWRPRPSLVQAGVLGVVMADPVSAPSVLRALLREGTG